MSKQLVSDEWWEVTEPLLTPKRPKPKGGRPPVGNRAEQKLPFLGAIYANAGFSHLPAQSIGLILYRARAMTCRQMVVLAYIARLEEFKSSWNRHASFLSNPDDITLLEEIQELYALGLIARITDGTLVGSGALDEIKPKYLVLNRSGLMLVELAGLGSIPTDEIERLVARYLREGQ